MLLPITLYLDASSLTGGMTEANGSDPLSFCAPKEQRLGRNREVLASGERRVVMNMAFS